VRRSLFVRMEVVLRPPGAGIGAHQGWIRVRGEFAVGHVVAENLEVAVVELLVVFAVEFAQCFGLVGLERRNGAIEHGFNFRRCAGLLGIPNPEHHSSTKAASADPNKLLFIGFSLSPTRQNNDSSRERALASPANCTARQRNNKGRIDIPQLVQ
jgi:hypothetical protein